MLRNELQMHLLVAVPIRIIGLKHRILISLRSGSKKKTDAPDLIPTEFVLFLLKTRNKKKARRGRNAIETEIK